MTIYCKNSRTGRSGAFSKLVGLIAQPVPQKLRRAGLMTYSLPPPCRSGAAQSASVAGGGLWVGVQRYARSACLSRSGLAGLNSDGSARQRRAGVASCTHWARQGGTARSAPYKGSEGAVSSVRAAVGLGAEPEVLPSARRSAPAAEMFAQDFVREEVGLELRALLHHHHVRSSGSAVLVTSSPTTRVGLRQAHASCRRHNDAVAACGSSMSRSR